MCQRSSSSLMEDGRSLPARTRQPGISDSVAKRRRPRVTNVEEPPMTLRSGG
jgi:hypothetical protein